MKRVFSVFDLNAAASSRCQNYKFKAKSIQNDMMLHKSTMTIPNKNVKQIFKLLNQRRWLEEAAKHFQRQKILKKLKKASNISICTNKLLQTCKSWGRPVTSINELDDILRAHGDLAEKIACAELSTETQNWSDLQ